VSPPNRSVVGPQGLATLPLLIEQALGHHAVGEAARALALPAEAGKDARRSPIACRMLALAYLRLERPAEALRWFNRALAVDAHDRDALAGKGMALQILGRFGDAVACYDRAHALGLGDAETLYNRAAALQAMGELEEAVRSYAAALAQRPSYALALMGRSIALERLGRFEEMLASLKALLAVEPNSGEGWRLVGDVLQRLKRPAEAVAAYDRALTLSGLRAAILINRAAALHELGRLEEALIEVDRALAAAPPEAEAVMLRANVLKDLGRVTDAHAEYRRAFALEPLLVRPAVARVPEFRALFLFAPMCGNTPIEDMIGASAYASTMVMLLPGLDHDVASLRRHGDVVVNLVSDADLGEEALVQSEALIGRIGRPYVNAPANVRRTAREAVAARIAQLPGCRAPVLGRYLRADLLGGMAPAAHALTFPAIVRIAGTHGGEAMERVDDASALGAFVREHPACAYYVSQFVDYRSADGYFRKYRFMFVGGEILPYHLAIDDKWKVHHATTDMVNRPWMQAEERAFLQDPHAACGLAVFDALRAIERSIGLNYAGVDCAVDAQGRVLVFEVNASMLVHLNNDRLPYKREPVRRIKEAFARMLKRKAQEQAQVA